MRLSVSRSSSFADHALTCGDAARKFFLRMSRVAESGKSVGAEVEGSVGAGGALADEAP
jgi:hypothetical protein